MGDRSAIGWTDATWNCLRGCSRVSAGCSKCYAERVAARFSGPGQPYHGLARRAGELYQLPNGDHRHQADAGWTGVVRMVPEHLRDPMRWRRPRRIFVASMSDPFHEKFSSDDIDSIMAVMVLADWHKYQLLTKRAARMREYMSDPMRAFKILRAIDKLEVDVAMEGAVEEWRPYPPCPLYEVSSFGNVRRNGRLLVQCSHGGGYRQVAICSSGVPKTTLVHRVVLEAFDRPPHEGEEAAHRNGDRTDNRIANLRWTSKEDNMQDAARQGTAGVWMKGRATLTHDQISDVRAARARGEKLDTIAARFGSNRQQISAITTGKIFKPAPLAWPLPNLWIGVSVENQDAADERIPELLATPAALRFLSCEPLLGELNLRRWLGGSSCLDSFDGSDGLVIDPSIDWLIDGCESGHGARPAEDAWFESLAAQCRDAGVPYFHKQSMVDGVLRHDVADFPPALRFQEFPKC